MKETNLVIARPEAYDAPECEQLNLATQSVLCESAANSGTTSGYDVEDYEW